MQAALRSGGERNAIAARADPDEAGNVAGQSNRWCHKDRGEPRGSRQTSPGAQMSPNSWDPSPPAVYPGKIVSTCAGAAPMWSLRISQKIER